MNPGILRHSIVIQQKSATRDAMGGETNTWTDFTTRRARIMPLQGRELADQRKLYAEVTHKIILRYVDSVVPTMRVKYTDPGTAVVTYYDIASVTNDDGQKRYMNIIGILRNA